MMVCHRNKCSIWLMASRLVWMAAWNFACPPTFLDFLTNDELRSQSMRLLDRSSFAAFSIWSCHRRCKETYNREIYRYHHSYRLHHSFPGQCFQSSLPAFITKFDHACCRERTPRDAIETLILFVQPWRNYTLTSLYHLYLKSTR